MKFKCQTELSGCNLNGIIGMLRFFGEQTEKAEIVGVPTQLQTVARFS